MPKLRPIHAWIDQHGQVVYARSAAELRRTVGGHMTKMYVDRKLPNGKTAVVHQGYVVGDRWFRRWAPVEIVESEHD